MRSARRLLCLAPLSIAAFVVAASSLLAVDAELPKQPVLGFDGQLVNISKFLPGQEGFANVGLQVDSVKRGTLAWKMGLERGDIIVAVDMMRFGTYKGYLQALRAAGQRPSIIVIDVRTQKMSRKSVNLPHAEPSDEDATPRKPDSYLVGITLESDVHPSGP
jgi:S1-C subfamily serine protease